MNRRNFLTSGVSTVLAAKLAAAQTPGPLGVQAKSAAGTASSPTQQTDQNQSPGWTGSNPRNALDLHRFGVNYTPSHNWYFCWNDWHIDPIRRDLDAIAALGADHMRIMLIWPFFQPNLTWVSPAHLERLHELLTEMEHRKLDALVTVFTGQLSGWFFLPPFNKPDPAMYSDPTIAAAQDLMIRQTASVLQKHSNLIGFDFGNEINTCWSAPTAIGDDWMKRMFMIMNTELPGCVHVNGVDNDPWFKPNTFTPQALAANLLPVMHVYPYWTGALKYGGWMDPPSTQLIKAFAALVRAYAGNPSKPVWAGEFNTCIEQMPEKQQARWLDITVNDAVAASVNWFTYWDSHDVNRKFAFNSLEYSLGLLTNDGKVKEQGRVFKELAAAYGGKPVARSTTALPPPPTDFTDAGTWQWILDYLHWKPVKS